MQRAIGARLILTCGLPGSGKTTLAGQLAKDRGAVRLTKDEWLWALGASPWDRATNEKVERELWRIAQEILGLGVEIKDLDQWLIDFPSQRDGRVVYLCWRRGEENIEWWHDMDAGFAGRQPL